MTGEQFPRRPVVGAGPRPFYSFPLLRLLETTDAAAVSIRTLPDQQLKAEREALLIESVRAVRSAPTGLMLALYDAELSRRESRD